MTDSPSVNHNVLETSDTHSKGFETFPSPKKNLSISLTSRSHNHPRVLKTSSDQEDRQLHSSDSDPESPSLHVNIPKIPDAVTVALATLQHLPSPLLVLSSSKTVILANDAIGRLLGLDTLEEPEDGTAAVDMLLGQSLSQLGIDMSQDGQQIWVSWEVMN